MNIQLFGNRVQQARVKKHLTGDQLAEQLNISSSFLRQIENGTRLPRLELLVKIANTLNCNTDYLLCDSLIEGQPIKLNDITEKLIGLSPERLNEVSVVVEAMLSYMKNE